MLLGESGGALPAGKEGNELVEEACGLVEFPVTFKGPAFASLINNVT